MAWWVSQVLWVLVEPLSRPLFPFFFGCSLEGFISSRFWAHKHWKCPPATFFPDQMVLIFVPSAFVFFWVGGDEVVIFSFNSRQPVLGFVFPYCFSFVGSLWIVLFSIITNPRISSPVKNAIIFFSFLCRLFTFVPIFFTHFLKPSFGSRFHFPSQFSLLF